MPDWLKNLFSGTPSIDQARPADASGLLDGWVGWFFGLFGLGAVATWLTQKFTEHSGYANLAAFLDDKFPKWKEIPVIGFILKAVTWWDEFQKKITDGIGNFFSGLLEKWGLKNPAALSGEQANAFADGQGLINADFSDIDTKLGLTGANATATAKVRELANQALKKFLDKKSDAPADAVAAAKEFQQEVSTFLVAQLKAQYPGKTDAEYQAAADKAAADIAGLKPDGTGSNTGFSKMLLDIQTAIKNTDYKTGQYTQDITYNTAVLDQARASLAGVAR